MNYEKRLAWEAQKKKIKAFIATLIVVIITIAICGLLCFISNR